MKISIIHMTINGIAGLILGINDILFYDSLLFWIILIPIIIITTYFFDLFIDIEQKIFDYFSNNKNIDKSEIMNEWDKLKK